jgi:acyl-CoA synthetase (AMP-forming)/AMP-acid ligase II/3-oxoacyl-(acyl-carrier-protein) synthase/acyl carrier protein
MTGHPRSLLRAATPGAHEPRSLVDVVRAHSERIPDIRAFTFLKNGETEDGVLTFSSIDERARRIAAWLQSNFTQGDRVVLLFPSGLDFIVTFLGCMYAGAIPIPVNLSRRQQGIEKLSLIAANSGAKLIMTNQSSFEELSSRFCKSAILRDLDLMSIEAVLASPSAQTSLWQPPELDLSSIAFIQYTSGSTGEPKGIAITHGNLLANQKMITEAFEHDANTVFVGWLPLHHDMGLVGNVLNPLYIGVRCILMSPVAFTQQPVRWLKAIAKYRATTSGGPDFAYDFCVQRISEDQMQGLDLRSWRLAFNGAEPIRADTLRRFSEKFASVGFSRKAFYPCYGMAEATLFISGGVAGAGPNCKDVSARALETGQIVVEAAADAHPSRTLVSCGFGHGDESIVIVDPSNGYPCPDGVVGEIWVKGSNVASGYWNNPALTKANFDAYVAGTEDGPFLRTGDLGGILDGSLYVAGRCKDLIIIRGQNHYPQDIERVVAQSNPGLENRVGVAFSVDIDGEERLVLVQEIPRLRARNLNSGELVHSIRQAVSEEYGISLSAALLVKQGSIPMTSSGKVQRRATKSAYLEKRFEPLYAWQETTMSNPEVDRSEEATISVPETYETVSAWIREVIARKKNLPLEEISLDESFASLGLDSLEIVALSGELASRLGEELSPTLVYDYPTIRLFSEKIAGKPVSQPILKELPAVVAEASPTASNAPAAVPEQDIAIVGMACRFPGADSVDAYWRLLEAGANAITEVPPDRWRVDDYYTTDWPKSGKMKTRWGGFIEDVDKFDAAFFGITPLEAESMDPQQRVLLSVTWHALEDAGIPAQTLAGSNTGVFIGINTQDYRLLHLRQGGGTDAYAGTGNGLCISAGRISYFFDLHGPCFAIDTACSSSLVAVHQARASLLRKECDVAIVGGINLVLAPDNTITFSQANLLSSDGLCKTFDVSANGYVRSDGCGVVILKRNQDARRDNDRVHALVVGSAINHDGRSNGLAAPNGLAQQQVLRRALDSAGVDPRDVSYVEVQGTGTSLGDSIEMNALKEVYGGASRAAPTLWVSTVKTNIGHLETASGVAALIKTALMLRHRKIPPHLHLRQLNPLISLEGSRVSIPDSLKDWQAPDGALRLAAVSAFGIGAANANVIMREAPADGAAPHPARIQGRSHILTLSAKSASALSQLAWAYAEFLATGGAREISLSTLCYTANARRTHHAHRLAVVVKSVHEAIDRLRHFARGENTNGVFSGFSAQTSDKNTMSFADDDANDHEKLAQWYVQGGWVDWPRYLQERIGAGAKPPKPIALPPYPFQQERYWFKVGSPPPVVALSADQFHPPLASEDRHVPDVAEQAPALASQISALSTEDAKAEILDYLFRIIAETANLGMATQAELRPNFQHIRVNELGLDSLMGVQLRNRILSEFGVGVPVQMFVGGSSSLDIAGAIYRQLVLNQLTKGAELAPGDGDTEEFVL